jgi:hypothetical protein
MQSLAFGTLPSLLPRIGGMATMPSRRDSLRRALPPILAQLDRLYLYLDQHDAVPDGLAHDPRIVPLLPDPGGPALRGAGKFLGLRAFGEPCLYFCFDDDILYPPGYVAHLSAALRRHRYRAVAGLHGAVYRVPVRSYVRDRKVLHFAAGLAFDCVVDELGTGTIAFHSGCVDLDVRRWAHVCASDLMTMLECIRQGVPRIAVRRPGGFLRPIAEQQSDSLYAKSLRDDSLQTRLMQAAFESYPDDWCLAG